MKSRVLSLLIVAASLTAPVCGQGLFSGLANRQDEIKQSKKDFEWIVQNYDPSVLISAELARKDDGTPDIAIDSDGDVVVAIKLDVNDRFSEWKAEASNRLSKCATQIVPPGGKVEGSHGSYETIVIGDTTFVLPPDMKSMVKEALKLRPKQKPGVCVFLLDVDGNIVAEPKTRHNTSWRKDDERHELDTSLFPGEGPLESVNWWPTFTYKGPSVGHISFGKLSKTSLDVIQDVRGCVGEKQVVQFWADQAALEAKKEKKRAAARVKTGQVVQDELDIAGIKYEKSKDGKMFISTFSLPGGAEQSVAIGADTYKSSGGNYERREIWSVAATVNGPPEMLEGLRELLLVNYSGGKFLGHWSSPDLFLLGMSSKYTLVYTIRIPANAEASIVRAAMEECATVAAEAKKQITNKFGWALAD